MTLAVSEGGFAVGCRLRTDVTEARALTVRDASTIEPQVHARGIGRAGTQQARARGSCGACAVARLVCRGDR